MGKKGKNKTGDGPAAQAARHKAAAAKKREERLKKAQLARERKQKGKKGANYESDFTKFNAQMDTLGLWIRDTRGDGNCLFRAIGDQLEGDMSTHMAHRQITMDYIAAHQEGFEPFVEDDEPFDAYVARMRKNAEWAGHLELQAMSLAHNVNIIVHQLGQPRWQIINFPEATTRAIHLSYHDGEHYASVRSKADDGKGPALSIVIGTPKADGSASEHKSADAPTEDELLVMRSTAGVSLEHVRETLASVGGDTETAIEVLIAEMAEGAGTYGAPAPAASAGASAAATTSGGAAAVSAAPAAASASASAAAGSAAYDEDAAVVAAMAASAIATTDPASSSYDEDAAMAAALAASESAGAHSRAPAAASSQAGAAAAATATAASTSSDKSASDAGGSARRPSGSSTASTGAGTGGGSTGAGKGTTSGSGPGAVGNEPCSCGSGRKYKKCCYKREKNAAKLEAALKSGARLSNKQKRELARQERDKAEAEGRPPPTGKKGKPKTRPPADGTTVVPDDADLGALLI